MTRIPVPNGSAFRGAWRSAGQSLAASGTHDSITAMQRSFYPLLAMARHAFYSSRPLEIADLARTIIPPPIAIANSGITTAGVPIVLIASERK